MKGISMSLISEVVILPKLPAMITPMAMSSTLPRAMNSLNSLIKFFISLPPCYWLIYFFFSSLEVPPM